MVGVVVSDVTVEVHSAQLFAPGGDVNRWARRTARELREAAQGFAPPRRTMARIRRPGTGRLNHSIKGNALWDGAKDYDIVLSADTPYAIYVHEGTASQGRRYIYTSLGWANKGLVDTWIKLRQFRASPDEAGFYMPLPGWSWANRDPGGFKMTAVLRVHGQKKNPFLRDGYTLVQKRHGELPPLGRV